MKIFQRSLLLLFTSFLLIVFYNYPRLNIMAGYAAKMTGSSVFLAKRDLHFTDSTDTNFKPISLVKNRVDEISKTTYSSAFGLLNRKAVYREGFGNTLLIRGKKIETSIAAPKRTFVDRDVAFPYGNGDANDTVFANINYSKLNESVAEMFSDLNKTRAVLVIYKDKIIAERYDKGFDKNSLLLGWSMTKSLTSTLFGVLQHDGKIDVQARAPFKEWENDKRSAITIHNLLQMNSGLEWNEDYNSISDVTKMLFLSEDVTKSQLQKPLTGKPNESWNYSSGTTNLLSGILRKQFSTHQEYIDFWYSGLIDRIGMNSMVVETDMKGNYIGSSYAWATARDWAKFGLLYLHNGNWNGDTVFTKDWVDYATTPTPTSDGWYGAQIWLNAGSRYPDVPKSMYSFNGYQGQNVFILPEQDLVIVRLGLTKNADINTFLSGVLKAIE
jgi:CubicO group peptidase (beta-lactamase class C family)